MAELTGKEAACRKIAERHIQDVVQAYNMGVRWDVIVNKVLGFRREAYDAGAKAWRDAIEDRLFVLHLSMNDDPKLALDNLIGWEVKVALDPKVSEEARKLKDEGAKAQREQDAQIAEPKRKHCKCYQCQTRVSVATAIRRGGQ